MQEGLTWFELDGFNGVWNWEIDSRIPKDKLFDALNLEFQGGRWQVAQGVTGYLPALTGGTDIKGLFYYPYQDMGVNTNYLLQYYNSQFYEINVDNDTRSLIAGTTFSVDEDIGGIPYNNEFFIVSPNNGMGYIDGATWGNTFDGVPPAGSMLEVNSEKLWCAGVPGFPSVIYYSRTATAANPEYIKDWTDGAGSALIGKGGYITAIKNLKATLYVFKNDGIYYLSNWDFSGDFPIPIFDVYAVTAGAINNKCVVQVENDLWFLTPSLEVRSLGSVAQYINDTRTSDVSLAIKNFIKTLATDQSEASMEYFDKVLKITLKTTESSTNNWVFTYDFNDNDWSIKRIASVKDWVNDSKRDYFIEPFSGQLYIDDSGYSKNGLPYAWNGKTLMVDLGVPYQDKRLRYIEIYCARSPGQTINACVYTDSYEDPAPTCWLLEPPTIDEIGIVSSDGDGQFGNSQFGGVVFGGTGAESTLEPDIFRRRFLLDVSITGRMFGLELFDSVNGTRVEIYAIRFGLIPLPVINSPVTN